MAGILGKRLSSWKHVTSLVKCLQHRQMAVQSVRNYSVVRTSVGIQDDHKLCRGIQLREIHLTRCTADDYGKFSSTIVKQQEHFSIIKAVQ